MCFFFPLNRVYAQSQKSTANDSLFEKVSIDELLKIKDYYNKKSKRIQEKEKSSLSEGKKLGESFLSDKGVKIKDRDKIYIRIAEYYIEEADQKYLDEDDNFQKADDEYQKQLSAFEAGKLDKEPVEPQEPKIDYSGAIKIYNKLLTEYPASDFADDALYGKAWLLGKMSQGSQSRRFFQEVIDKYPDSPFAPESYMQLAEYYFRPRADKTGEDQSELELRKAIQLYKKVLRYKGSPRYDEALYKLGWSYYKLASRDPKNYNNSITYFMMVADDIQRAKKLDPESKISQVDVADEAIEYVGISFTDKEYTKNGVDKARRMLEKIGGRSYGVEIMRAIGNTYKKIDEQNQAIYAFNTLLEMYPNYKEAALVQDYIASALYSSGKDKDAYNARKILYESYNPKSEWYKKLETSDLKDKVKYLNEAYNKSEQAFRSNLLTDLDAAQESDKVKPRILDKWRTFADEAYQYLQMFPSDSNAYDIHWNYALALDQKLSEFDKAFNEYLTVSTEYLEKTHQEDAAAYAVGVADTLVKIKYGNKNDSVKISLADIAQLNPESLTPEETNLIQAYDNYIKLFPDGKYTPDFLAAAGGIYYNHKKFAEAKVYFQTLVHRFPGAKEKSLAMRSIMDSYFALGKFKDSEVIAKRILADTTLPAKQREFASKRLAEAIFKNAEYLEEQGDFFTAANEFYRLYKEVHDDKRYIEPALWNAGLNYQKARDWVRSNETFNIIAEEFPKSKFAHGALIKLVDNYKELEQYDLAASTSERIYTTYPKADDADVRLYNASYFYQKAEKWNEAIRVNNIYIAAYPKVEYAVDLFFKNAELYLKLDNLVEANRIYDEFAKRYPNDSRVINAFYERGKYFLENGQVEAAKTEFNKTIATSEKFRKEGKDSNPFIAGEAVNKLADILHTEFMAINLILPKSEYRTRLQRLKTLLNKLNQAYSKVLLFGSPRSFEAVYDIARSYEEFADKFAKQELDQNLSPAKYYVTKKAVYEQAASLMDNAVNKYKEVAEKIPVIAQKLDIDMFSADSVALPDSSVDKAREVEIDSTRQLALKWYHRAKDKISELLYDEAQLTSSNVSDVLALKPPPLSTFETIIYQGKILTNAVAPGVELTIKAHLRNVKEAESLGLSNKYVEESKRQILLISNVLAQEYEKLSAKTIDEYKNDYADYVKLIDQPEGAKNAAGMNYYDLATFAKQMIEENNRLNNSTLDALNNTLDLAADNQIQNDITRATQEKVFKFALATSKDLDDLNKEANAQNVKYEALFDSTNNYNYDDGRNDTEEIYYALSDNSMALLEHAFEIKDEKQIKGVWPNRLMAKLLELDPAKYSASIDKEKVEFFTDDTWLYTLQDYQSKWIDPDFSDADWSNADVLPAGVNQFSSINVNPSAIWIKTPLLAPNSPSFNDSLSTDSVGTFNADTSNIFNNDSTRNNIGESDSGSVAQNTNALNDTLVFFRKNVMVDGKIVEGKIYVTADDDYRLYLNGEYLIDDEANDYSVLDTLDFYTLERYVRTGKNIIAVDVKDNDKTAGGLKLYGYFEVIPSDIFSNAEAAEAKKQDFINPKILKTVNILQKNRIPLRK